MLPTQVPISVPVVVFAIYLWRKELLEKYKEPLKVEFDMPGVRLLSMKSRPELGAIKWKLLRSVASWALATRNRKFVLEEDLNIVVNDFYDNGLNGKLIIPASDSDGKIKYDGASIPLPWLVSAFSAGVLRPLGPILIPSIVHDHLFVHGEIKVSDKHQQVDRETADRLFLYMFQSVSGMRFWPMVAWLAVRVGSPFTEYNGSTEWWGREARYTVAALLGIVLLISFLYSPIIKLTVGLLLALFLLNWVVETVSKRYGSVG